MLLPTPDEGAAERSPAQRAGSSLSAAARSRHVCTTMICRVRICMSACGLGLGDLGQLTFDVGEEFLADGFGDLGIAAVGCDWGRGSHALCLVLKRLMKARAGSDLIRCCFFD